LTTRRGAPVVGALAPDLPAFLRPDRHVLDDVALERGKIAMNIWAPWPRSALGERVLQALTLGADSTPRNR